MKTQTPTKERPSIKVVSKERIADRLDATLVSSKNIQLTKDRAHAYLDMPTFQGERPPNERWVQNLYNEWEGGRFRWEDVSIAVAILGRKKFRLNGQHSCWLRVNLDKNEKCLVRELVYRVNNEHALRSLYCTFDKGKSRSYDHSFRAIIYGSRIATDLWHSQLALVGSGLKFWLHGDSQKARDTGPADLAALCIDKYSKLFRTVAMLHQANTDIFSPTKRVGVIAGMFATFDKDTDKAVNFWEPVCTAIGLTANHDPRLKLRRYLETHGRSDRGTSGLTLVSKEETYRVCVKAWNHWRKGEPCPNLRATDKRVEAV